MLPGTGVLAERSGSLGRSGKQRAVDVRVWPGTPGNPLVPASYPPGEAPGQRGEATCPSYAGKEQLSWTLSPHLPPAAPLGRTDGI